MGVIIDRNAGAEIFKKLDELKIEYCKSYNMTDLYFPVNTHPDMQIHFINETHAVAAPCVYRYYKEMLPGSVILEKGVCDPKGTYPHDCAYNVVRLGDRVIGNFKYVDERIKQIYSEMGAKFINVKQGYAKCNLCVIDESSAITEDVGLFNTLKGYGIDLLLLKTNEVSLNGFPYGFIGGASGKIDSKTIAFFGDVKKHTEFNEIESFISKKKVNIIYLSQTKIWDYGSIIKFVCR